MKTTKRMRDSWRERDDVSHAAFNDTADDLDEALADAEAWKARAERAEKALRDIRQWAEAEGNSAIVYTCNMALAARPDEPSKPGGREP